MKSLLMGLLIISVGLNAQTLCEDGYAGEFPCEGVDLYAHMDINDYGGGQNTNDCWGWVSPSGKEIAIVGRSNGTAFIDISNPGSPIYLGNLPSHQGEILWRDIKVYDNHAFVVSESGMHGMQVFDMTQLDYVVSPPQTFEETAHYADFGNAHNIVINEATAYAYAVGTNTFSGGLHIIDISTPSSPSLAGAFADDGYTHDAQAVIYTGPDSDYSGKEIVIACNEDYVTFVDVSDKSDCQLISTVTYDNEGYVHQGWLTEDQRFFLNNDETDEFAGGFNTRTHLWNVEDLDNPVYLGYYEADVASSDHNLYTHDGKAYLTNYLSGLRILNLDDIANGNVEEIAYFDTQPGSDDAGYQGTWSNYPYFPSGSIILSDMFDGFFVVKETQEVVGIAPLDETSGFQIYPSPAADHLTIEYQLDASDAYARIFSLDGKEVKSIPMMGRTGKMSFDISDLSSGMYVIQIGNPDLQERFIVK